MPDIEAGSLALLVALHRLTLLSSIHDRVAGIEIEPQLGERLSELLLRRHRGRLDRCAWNNPPSSELIGIGAVAGVPGLPYRIPARTSRFGGNALAEGNREEYTLARSLQQRFLRLGALRTPLPDLDLAERMRRLLLRKPSPQKAVGLPGLRQEPDAWRSGPSAPSAHARYLLLHRDRPSSQNCCFDTHLLFDAWLNALANRSAESRDRHCSYPVAAASFGTSSIEDAGVGYLLGVCRRCAE